MALTRIPTSNETLKKLDLKPFAVSSIQEYKYSLIAGWRNILVVYTAIICGLAGSGIVSTALAVGSLVFNVPSHRIGILVCLTWFIVGIFIIIYITIKHCEPRWTSDDDITPPDNIIEIISNVKKNSPNATFRIESFQKSLFFLVMKEDYLEYYLEFWSSDPGYILPA